MNTDSGENNDRDPVFDRLPEKVKREFLEKKRKEEALMCLRDTGCCWAAPG